MKPLLRRLLLWVALPVLLVALATWKWKPREPSWDGRSLSQWLEYVEPDSHRMIGAVGEQNTVAATRAIQGMGTNCLPFLLRRMEDREPTRLEMKLMKLEHQLLKRSVISVEPTIARVAARSNRLLWAFKALGDSAAPAVPELQRWLFSTNSNDVGFVADLLTRIHPDGTAALIAAATNQTIPKREPVLWALRLSGEVYPDAFTAFVGRSDDPDPRIRAAVAATLFDERKGAAVFLPVIIRLLADPEASVRSAACLSLRQTKGDIRPAESAITALAADPEPLVRDRAIALLLKINANTDTPPPAAPVPPP